MAEYYCYVNDTKKQFFWIDPIQSGALTKHALGRNIGARILTWLLRNPDRRHHDEHALIGSWVGDRVYLKGDHEDDFNEMEKSYSNCASDVIEMMITHVPHDLVEFGGVDWVVKLAREGEHILTDEKRYELYRHFQVRKWGGSPGLAEIVAALRAPRPKPRPSARGDSI